jgi:hypothetical protein
MSRIVGAGGGGGGCFLGHTLIRTLDGLRAIETLQPGDQVLSFDDQGGLHQGKVLKVHVHENERVVRYRLWGGAVLDATPNHWVLNQFNAFVEIGTLGADDCLVDENGHLRPIVERTEHGRGTVYNLTVEGHHTFIAGGIRVHNAGLGLGIVGAGGGGDSGKGGGGSSARTPTEAADNLNSTAYAKLIDMLCEGEIQGLRDGIKSIYLNNTPLQNPDDSYNFQNVTVITRNGTQAQSYIPGFDDVSDEKGVGVTVQQATPVVRSITDTTVNAVRVTITVPALQQFNDQGDINGTDVRLQIAVQYNGGGYTTVIDDTIAGRTADSYQRDYLVNLSGAFPADIKVTRITADSGSAKLQNAFSWSSYTEITYAKLRYPNSALVALRVDAEQFNNIPSRSYLIRGLKVRIPSNATVDMVTHPGRLTYAGIWDGTFQAATYTNDPAWCLFDLLTSSRYGFGDHIDTAQLDKWAFYAASVYSNELVSDGYGSTEPRFSCNINIQTAEDAYKLINDMCSVFRVMPYWSTGSLTVSQDRPADSSYLFTLANISEEGFNYQGSSQKTRATVAVAKYFDLDLRDEAYEVVEDQAAIVRYGVITKEITAFACTSRGQARRLGEWLLYSEGYETEVVNFTASIDAGVLVRPGQIIEISDPVRAGMRRGGRIVSATTTTVTVDDTTQTDLSAGASPTLSVVLPDGTVETRAVTLRNGAVLTVSPAYSAAPNANSIWIYQTSDVQTSTWRVLTVQEQEGAQYAITALAHNASKYAYIERDVPLQQRDVTNLNEAPDAPGNLRGSELLYESNDRVLSKLLMSWRPVVTINQYLIRYRQQNGNWASAVVERPDYEILDTSPGNYEIQVYSINAAGKQSTQPANLSFTAYGRTAAPSNVMGVTLVPIDEASAILSWTLAPDLDVRVGGKVLIRHSPALVSATWDQATDIVPSAAGSQTQKQVPILEGTYLLRFEDSSGVRSVNSAMVVADLPEPQPRLLVEEYAEDQITPTPFTGTKVDMSYDGTLDGLILNSSGGSVLSEGSYSFSSTLDLGGVFDANLQRRFVTRAYLPNALWDSKPGLIDEWPAIDEDNLDGVNATLYVRATPDNPSSSPTWGAWREFANAILRGRGFQFKVIATSSDPAQNIVIDELGALVELQQRVEQSATITSGTGTYSVVYANAFYQAPSVGITGFNMATGDYFTIASVTRTGFQVTFRNSAGTAVSRQFTYTAIGYGREV